MAAGGRAHSVVVALFRALGRCFASSRVRSGPLVSALRVLAGMRVLLWPVMLRELVAARFHLDVVDRPGTTDDDPFPFFTRRHYLMRRMTMRDRMCAYLRHREFEHARRVPSYFDHVYGGAGLRLWRGSEGGAEMVLSLERSEERDRNEGELSVVLRVDGAVCSRVSFGYVQADLFPQACDRTPPDEPSGRIAMVIARSQTLAGPGRDRFVEVMPNESARMYTLAGVSGVAVADGFRRVRGVHETQQIGYRPSLADGFRRSYSDIWSGFPDAVDAGDHVSFDAEFPPAAHRPISAKNRSRARRRRRNWDAVRAAARLAVEQCSVPARHVADAPDSSDADQRVG